MLSRLLKTLSVSIVLATASLLFPAAAKAESFVEKPGEHLKYRFEAEPHLALGVDNIYASGGIGLGARLSIPVVENGFISNINNSVAVGAGLDFVHYSGCFNEFQSTRCSANYLFAPVVMQWNFYLSKDWSVFGEPGLMIFSGFYEECEPSPTRQCVLREPSRFGWRPVLYLGGRYRLSDSIALTMRIGYPSLSVGVSFM